MKQRDILGEIVNLYRDNEILCLNLFGGTDFEMDLRGGLHQPARPEQVSDKVIQKGA